MTKRDQRADGRRYSLWAVIGLMLGAALLLGACGSSASSGSASRSSTTSSSTTTATTAPVGFPYQPMFPFADLGEVAAWQEHDAGDAAQTWHRDAPATAVAFAQFLGYVEIDRVGTTTGDAQDAHVEVGGLNSDGRFSGAAVVHLVRYGSGRNVPWEVVGTDDTDFSLTTPRYGAGVTSPVAVGGTITGVDESISVTVRALHATGSLGGSCCVAAGGGGGGGATPWSTTAEFVAPSSGPIVIAAATGGHSRNVERFAVTAAIARQPGGANAR